MTAAMRNVFEKSGNSFALAVLVSALAVLPASAEPASPWIEGFKHKTRLLSGSAAARGEAAKPFAAVEIEMPEGWKTYWRAPGDAGGIPPEFDFTGSDNLARATVLYPAPKKLVDRTGATYGYKNHVIFPVAIEAADAARPVHLKLKAAYGICEDLCVPAEAELAITVEPASPVAPEIEAALAHVPATKPVPGTDPIVEKTERIDAGGKPVLRITAADLDASVVEAFVDSPEGLYLPVAKKVSGDGGKAVFDVDLTDGVDVKEIEGKPIAVTLTGAKGQSETIITLP